MKVLSILTALYFLTVAASCHKDPIDTPACTEKNATSQRSINFFDLRSGSPYFNQVVANFKFTQITTTYSGSASCPGMNCKTTLLIQNATPKTISFDYNIIFSLNLINWNYQGVVTIPPGGSVDVGQLNNNCGSLSLGGILLQSKSIGYN